MHMFHQECIETWVRKGKNECPNCRQRVSDSPSEDIELVLDDINSGNEFEHRLDNISSENAIAAANLELINLDF